MVIVCDCKQKSEKWQKYGPEKNEGGPKNKHTDNQFHQENIRYTKRYLCSAICLMHTRAKA